MGRERTVKANGKIPVRESYGTGEVAWLFGVSATAMRKWLDAKTIPSYRLPAALKHRDGNRRVHHNSLLKYVEDHPEYEWILEKLDGDLGKYVKDKPYDSRKSGGIGPVHARPLLGKKPKSVSGAQLAKDRAEAQKPRPGPTPLSEADPGWKWYR